MYVVPWRHKNMYSYDSQLKKMDSYNIAKRTYDFVMTYMENCTINMTLVMLFPVGNKKAHLLLIKKKVASVVVAAGFLSHWVILYHLSNVI